ncbi:MFS multidrug transporter [Penicillium angulare]|uniref:MFS multidrug transporter n=1 Tax=Penicillium angulare TaxID=116970 RepID=UPI00254046ED|nr:MFS multidrug transporter [Penicillium angulare]KAJ5287976.1 MFS multidrug transporter [Penicillium angulare]
MRRTYHDLWAGEEGRIPAAHIEHCLDSLRQDIMCKADDTPMPSRKLYNGGGEGQMMQCKDFDKLVAWTQAPERNACYKRLTDYQKIVHSVERYAFCPRDSEHYDAMDQYFQEHGHYADPFSDVMITIGQTQEQTSTPDLVDFTEDDPSNPLNWSTTYKWFIVVLTACLSTIVQLCTIIAAPVSPSILAHFNSDNTLYRTLIVSIWELGEIIAPLIWGPLSEQYGRQWVLHVANFLFVAFLVGTSLSTNIQMIIAFRFLSGAATAASPVGPGIVKDLFAEEHRGRAMSIMSLTGALGPVIGPIIGSYLGERAGWRWAFWLPTIVSGTLSLLLFAFYRETYKVTILQRRAKQLVRETGNTALRSKYDNSNETTTQRLLRTAIRPLRLLFRFPVLALITIYISAVYGFTYLIMTTIAPVFQENYHFSEGASGLSFLGLCLGLVFGALLCSWALDRYLRMVRDRHNGQEPSPEQRLPPVFLACFLMCGGFLLFGWTVRYHIQYVVPIIGTGMIGFALAVTTISVQTYIIDSFGIYATSAISAMLMPRNATAAFLPLVGPPMFSALGHGWGGTLVGFLVLMFAPMPLLLMRYSKKLKAIGDQTIVD